MRELLLLPWLRVSSKSSVTRTLDACTLMSLWLELRLWLWLL